jgi:hypothetical protein
MEKRKERKTYALIVEKKGTQYKDVRSSIHAIRSTRDGSLLITLDRDEATIEGLEKAREQVTSP